MVVSGGLYQPLTSDPTNPIDIGGTIYGLNYADDAGFSYEADDGTAYIGSGDFGAASDGGPSMYPFDITDPAAVAQALTDFAAMDASNPLYQQYLDAFGAVRTLASIPEADIENMNQALGQSLIYSGGAWKTPPFDINDPTAAKNYAMTLPLYRADSAEYRDVVAALNAAASKASGVAKDDITSALTTELLAICGTSSGSPPSIRQDQLLAVVDDWGQVNFAGRNLSFVNLSNIPRVTGGMLNSAQSMNGTPILRIGVSLQNADISGLSLAGLNFSGKNASGVNFSGTSVTSTQLNAATSIMGANLSGLNLSGVNLARVPGYNSIKTTNLAGATNLNLVSLGQANDLSYINFGTQDLSTVTFKSGVSIMGANLTGSNVTGTQLAAATDLRYSNLSGLNLSGMNFAKPSLSLQRTNLAGVTGVTGTQLSSVGQSALVGADLSGLNLTGMNLANKDISEVSFKDSNLSIAMISGAQKQPLTNVDFRGTTVTARQLIDAGWTMDQIKGAMF